MNNLSPEQKIAYSKFLRGKNLFITGPGGTGKTKLIHHFIEYATITGISHQVCAMTGCAAILLGCKARTLHSWSGIKLAKGSKDEVIQSVLKNKKVCRSIKSVRLLIIDEVSMMSQKIFEIIDDLCRQIKGRPFAPFGGIQVIFTGDFFQLPPVGSYHEPETVNMCFESPLWDSVFPFENVVELKTIFRQNDPTYIDILSQVRRGYLDNEYIDLLRASYVRREYNPNNHYGCAPTKLFALRNKAEYINDLMFSKIDKPCYESKYTICTTNTKYIDTCTPIPSSILRECHAINAAEVEKEVDTLTNTMQAEQVFQFKVGALVMCTKNISLETGICNGTHGVIIDILRVGDANAVPIVQFANGVKMTMSPVAWQSEMYPTISVHQIPLRLAWALTIHKIQGATMDMAEMDIGHTVFEYGQIYVALSRIKSLDGLYLLNFQPEKIKANPKVIAFYDRIQHQHNSIATNETESEAFSAIESFEYVPEEVVPVKDPTIKICRMPY